LWAAFILIWLATVILTASGGKWTLLELLPPLVLHVGFASLLFWLSLRLKPGKPHSVVLAVMCIYLAVGFLGVCFACAAFGTKPNAVLVVAVWAVQAVIGVIAILTVYRYAGNA
jgi:hypothetical protein